MTLSTPALARLAAAARRPPPTEDEHCDLCGIAVPATHRHLFDLRARTVLCVCPACRILFDRGAAGGAHYRLIPERRSRLEDFDLGDQLWDQLGIPVSLAYLTTGDDGAMLAVYPGVAGAALSPVRTDVRDALLAANPVMSALVPEVEGILVCRHRQPHQHFIVPMDDCYRLTGIIRTHWKGFSGGGTVWREINHFIDDLGRAARATRRI
ncbi:MAG TPA: DUF5947 family protein [Gemmatimonadales bacterium]|nr:DUF5947 family protein [Gemmatimonadales bacterium]